ANGVAVFSGLSINKAGTGYTLTASSPGLVGTTSDPFNVAAARPPHIVKNFNDATINFSGTTMLFFTIYNPTQTLTLTGITFIDDLPPGLQVAATPALSNSCGGTANAQA